MATIFYLVRCGETIWHQQGKLPGRRDLTLSEAGQRQARDACELLSSIELTDLLCSPLARAVETASAIGRAHSIEPGRDPRLLDLEMPQWEGRPLAELDALPEFQKLLQGEEVRVAGIEDLKKAQARAVSSVEQAVMDNDFGANIAVVTHSMPLRLVLAHYLGMPARCFSRLEVDHGSVSVLVLGPDQSTPRVRGTNWTPITWASARVPAL